MNEQSGTRELRSAAGIRLALFSGNYNYTRDGANKALNTLVAHLLEHGAEVRVFSPTGTHPAFPPAGDLVSVPSVAIPGRAEFRVALGLPRAIKEQVRAFRPNLVHLSAPDWLGTAAQRFARRLKVPVVASLHTRFETYFEYYGLPFLRNWAWQRQARFYRSSDLVLAPNSPSHIYLREMGVADRRIGTWSRGVEPRIFNPNRRDMEWRRALDYSDSEPIILFLGRLVREKGIETFIRTIRELRRRGLPVRPLVIGSGPAGPEMKSKIGKAHFLGHLEGKQLGRAIASADILFNPSMTEAFGNVNLEAMAAGLAIVSADVGSARALIDHGRSGILCEPNVETYASAIEQLAGDPRRREALGRAAAASAAMYRWPIVLDRVVSQYRELLSRNPAAMAERPEAQSTTLHWSMM